MQVSYCALPAESRPHVKHKAINHVPIFRINDLTFNDKIQDAELKKRDYCIARFPWWRHAIRINLFVGGLSEQSVMDTCNK